MKDMKATNATSGFARKFNIAVAAVTFAVMVAAPMIFVEYIKYGGSGDGEIDYSHKAREYSREGNYAAARSVYEFMLAAGVKGHETALANIEELTSLENSYLNKGYKFGKGFVSGSVDDTSSLAGTLTADMTVFGDARDIIKNSYNYVSGGEVDELNVILSTIGLASTLAPHIDAGISLCKTAARAMNSGLKKALMLAASEASKYKKYEKLNDAMGAIGKLYAKTGALAFEIVKRAKSVEEIKTISLLVEKFGNSVTAGLLIGGEKAYEAIVSGAGTIYRTTVKSAPRMVAFIIENPGLAARAIKILKKAGIDHLGITAMSLLWLMAKVPSLYLFIALFALWFYMFRKTIFNTLVYRPVTQ